MNNKRRIAKNATILFSSQIISYILVFLYTIYIARYLGAEGYGILAFALSFSGIFSIFLDLGLSTLAVREVARNKSLAKKYIGNILVIKILLSFLTFGLIVLFINLLGYSLETILVMYFVSLSVILNSIVGIQNSIFQANEKMEYLSLGQILGSVIIFVGVLIVIYYKFDVIGVSLVFLASSVVMLFYTFAMFILNFSIPKLEYDLQFWIDSIKEALPFGLTGISGMVYTYIDSVMLSLFQGNEVVGWYNAAYRLVLFLLFIPGTINMAVFPSMSQLYISSPRKLKLINEKYFKFMIIIAIPIGTAFTILADKLIFLIFGNGYEPSIIALQILIWTIVFTFLGAGFVRLLEATNKQMILTKISGISLIVNIILIIILIPRFSLIGASIATVLTEIVLIGGVYWISYKYGYGIPLKQIFDNLIKIVIASLIMGILIYYLKNLNLLFLSFVSILTYILILFALKGIDNEDMRIIKELLKIN